MAPTTRRLLPSITHRRWCCGADRKAALIRPAKPGCWRLRNPRARAGLLRCSWPALPASGHPARVLRQSDQMAALTATGRSRSRLDYRRLARDRGGAARGRAFPWPGPRAGCHRANRLRLRVITWQVCGHWRRRRSTSLDAERQGDPEADPAADPADQGQRPPARRRRRRGLALIHLRAADHGQAAPHARRPPIPLLPERRTSCSASHTARCRSPSSRPAAPSRATPPPTSATGPPQSASSLPTDPAQGPTSQPPAGLIFRYIAAQPALDQAPRRLRFFFGRLAPARRTLGAVAPLFLVLLGRLAPVVDLSGL